jgi:hypothetical protein
MEVTSEAMPVRDEARQTPRESSNAIRAAWMLAAGQAVATTERKDALVEWP